MSKTNYVTMTDQELKCYFLEHRDDADSSVGKKQILVDLQETPSLKS